MKAKFHWLLSVAMLGLLGWQIHHLVSQPTAQGFLHYGSAAPQLQPWFLQTDVVIALLAAALFVTLLLTPSRQA